ncbi:hypothetical protein ACFX19_041148 [Malus domestica]
MDGKGDAAVTDADAAVKVEMPAGVKELENGGCNDWRLMALSLGREERRGRRRGAGLSLGEPWELTRWSLLAVLCACAQWQCNGCVMTVLSRQCNGCAQ